MAAKIAKPNPNAIIDIPVDQILIDRPWNSRSGAWEDDSGDEESQEFNGLVESIKEDGQKTPCTVRLIEGDKPYDLLVGFRRAAAVQKLAAESDKPAVLRCIVIQADDLTARLENMRENATRSNLKVPDLCWGLWDIAKRAKEAGEPLSDSQIANRLGLNQTYVSRLLRIAENLKANIFRRWREGNVAVSVAAMTKIAKIVPKDAQDAAFAELIGANVGDDDKPVKKTSWVESAKKKVITVASAMGKLEQMELISVVKDFDFAANLDILLDKMPAQANGNQRRSIGAAASKAYKTALEAPLVEEDDYGLDDED